jgi:isopenicillin-N N-acyltransferase-like protein
MTRSRSRAFLVVLAAVVWGVTSSAQTEIKSEFRTIPPVPSLTLVNGIHYVTLDAPTAYGRGYQHGAALRYVIQKGVAQWKLWIHETLGQQEVEMEIAEFINDTDYLKGIRKHTPDLYEELQGIAKGAGVDFQTLYAYQMFDEFVVHAVEKYRLAHCSGFGVYGRDGLPNLLGQNNDLPPYYAGTHTVLRIKYPRGHEALVFTWAGLLAQNGVNNRNVGVTMNIVPTAKGQSDGVPMPYIIRSILEKKDRKEAVSFLKSLGGSAAPMNFIIGDATKVVTVENTADGAKLIEDFHGESWVAHTNHHLDLDTSTLEPKAVSKTVERLVKLDELLKGRSAGVDAARAKEIFRTKPVLKNFETDPGFPTMESIVIELIPGNPRIHVSPGPPDGNSYSTFDFEQGYVGTEQ